MAGQVALRRPRLASMEPLPEERSDGSQKTSHLTCEDAPVCEHLTKTHHTIRPLCSSQDTKTASDLHASAHRDLTLHLSARTASTPTPSRNHRARYIAASHAAPAQEHRSHTRNDSAPKQHRPPNLFSKFKPQPQPRPGVAHPLIKPAPPEPTRPPVRQQPVWLNRRHRRHIQIPGTDRDIRVQPPHPRPKLPEGLTLAMPNGQVRGQAAPPRSRSDQFPRHLVNRACRPKEQAHLRKSRHLLSLAASLAAALTRKSPQLDDRRDLRRTQLERRPQHQRAEGSPSPLVFCHRNPVQVLMARGRTGSSEQQAPPPVVHLARLKQAADEPMRLVRQQHPFADNSGAEPSTANRSASTLAVSASGHRDDRAVRAPSRSRTQRRERAPATPHVDRRDFRAGLLTGRLDASSRACRSPPVQAATRCHREPARTTGVRYDGGSPSASSSASSSGAGSSGQRAYTRSPRAHAANAKATAATQQRLR